jgi:hypothetical protein
MFVEGGNGLDANKSQHPLKKHWGNFAYFITVEI